MRRYNYDEIKTLVLDAYYSLCRDRGIGMGSGPIEVLAHVAYAFENSFESSIENLMLNTVILVLSVGYYEPFKTTCTEQIKQTLVGTPLADLLDGIPIAEANVFRNDLARLGFRWMWS